VRESPLQAKLHTAVRDEDAAVLDAGGGALA